MRRDTLKGFCLITSIVILGVLLFWLHDRWSTYRDTSLKQIEKNEAKASFKAQIVTTDNGIQIFIREIDGKIYGNIVNQEP